MYEHSGKHLPLWQRPRSIHDPQIRHDRIAASDAAFFSFAHETHERHEDETLILVFFVCFVGDFLLW